MQQSNTSPEQIKQWAKEMDKKFLVLKNDDIDQFIHPMRMGEFNRLLSGIDMNRRALGKAGQNDYLVINLDEPYAAEVIEIMKRHGHWGKGE